MSNIYGIKGQTLDITVVGCTKLKNTEFISRQDPYVIIEYGNTKIRTKTCKDGGKNPVFNEKYQIPLIEGLQEINLFVWNSNTFKRDTFIGGGRVHLHKVLSEGYDDSSCMLQCNNNKFAGDVKLILHFSKPPRPERSAYVVPASETPYYYNAQSVQPAHYHYSSSFRTLPRNDSDLYRPPLPAHYQQPPVYPPHQQMPVYPPPQQVPVYPPTQQPSYYPPTQQPYYPPGGYPRNN